MIDLTRNDPAAFYCNYLATSYNKYERLSLWSYSNVFLDVFTVPAVVNMEGGYGHSNIPYRERIPTPNAKPN